MSCGMISWEFLVSLSLSTTVVDDEFEGNSFGVSVRKEFKGNLGIIYCVELEYVVWNGFFDFFGISVSLSLYSLSSLEQ